MKTTIEVDKPKNLSSVYNISGHEYNWINHILHNKIAILIVYKK